MRPMRTSAPGLTAPRMQLGVRKKSFSGISLIVSGAIIDVAMSVLPLSILRGEPDRDIRQSRRRFSSRPHLRIPQADSTTPACHRRPGTNEIPPAFAVKICVRQNALADLDWHLSEPSDPPPRTDILHSAGRNPGDLQP